MTTARLAAWRIAISLVQGAALWVVYKGAVSGSRELSTALWTLALFVPVVAIAGLGNLRPRTLIVWVAVAAVLCLGLGYHHSYRDPSPGFFGEGLFFAVLNGCMVGLLFIGHSLVVAGDTDRRWIASFPTYFDVAWRHATQLALAVLFTGVFFGFLWLGAELFDLIKIHLLWDLLKANWFWIPAMTVAFATALHFTDTRTAMVRGARTLVLSLLSWLLPIMTLIAVGFLCALPFTGLAPLWATRHATSILLTAAIALILLINSHFQDGTAERERFPLLVYSRAAAALGLLPLTVLAAIGLKLRVDQHGLTPSRIVALAFVMAVACHALGYFVAVVRSRAALRGLPLTNVLSAFVIVALMIALLTPLADPARLSVRSQVARLESGAITPRQFDFGFLKFASGRYGRDELERLKNMKDGPGAAEIAQLATAEAARPYRSARAEPPATAASREQNITVLHPRGAKLPESFLRMNWSTTDYRIPPCLKIDGRRCDALLVDLDGDGAVEILVLGGGSQSFVFKEGARGTWESLGALGNADCKGVLEALRSGDFQVVAPQTMDIVAAGQQLQIRTTCSTR